MSGLVNHGQDRKHSFSFIDASDCSSLWSDDDQEFVDMDVFTACSIGQYDCVRQHLADGMEFAELDKANFGGWTPLMYAAYVGHDNIVNLLLDCHVNVNARTTKYGATSLMLAASCGNESVVYFLLQNGAKINVQDNRGWTGLYYATFQGHQNVVKLLLESGANKELREHNQGLTPLLAAAQEGHEVIYEMLCTYGANLTANTNTGESARSLAFRHGNMSIVNITDQHSFRDVPSYFLRSEPGLLPDYNELVPPDDKVEDWLQCRNKGLETTIQDGPEAFAKLMSYQQADAKPLNIPILQGNSDEVGYTAASPCNLSVTPKNSECTVGSYEEHFFINCGKTVESARLHKQLQKMNLEKEDPKALERNHKECMPSLQPTVAGFLQDLKLTKYIPVFEEQDVDFETLLTFTDNDLKEVGIFLFGPRRKIFRAISRWKEEHQHAAIHPSFLASSEVQKLQAQLSQEKQLRVIAEGCVMEERAKRQEIYTRVCKLQEQWRQTEGELEKLEGLKQEIARGEHLPADRAEEFHARLETSISNLSKLASLGTIGANNVIFGNHNTTSGNSSGSSGNSSF